MKQLLSTQEMAQAVGVSRSTVRRLTDRGTIPSLRTLGGHRRIPVRDAVQYIRKAGAAVVRPEVFEFEVVSELSDSDTSDQQLLESLRQGDAQQVSGILIWRYLHGYQISEICDGPVRLAMQRIGELWRQDQADIYVEHRATEACAAGLHQLGALLADPPAGAPAAISAAPANDPYTLGPLTTSMTLRSAGWRTVNLGPDTPLASLIQSVRDTASRLVAVSVSSPQAAIEFGDSLGDLTDQMRQLGARLVLGGRAVDQVVRLNRQPHVCRTLDELVDFAGDIATQRRQARGAVSTS